MPFARKTNNKWRKLSFSSCRKNAQEAVARCLKGPLWKTGSRVSQLQQQLARNVGVPSEWVVLTNSCTSSLAAAHQFVKHPDCGHRVPLLTYAATAAWLHLQDHIVSLQDCDEDGWALSHCETEVDLWGRTRPRPTAPSVLDAAHRFAAPEHKELAEQGTAICYSFGPMKEVACWSGGALVWNRLADEDFRHDVEAFLNYGQSGRLPTGRGGINGYMKEVEAALISKQMGNRRRDEDYERRQRVLQAYENTIPGLLVTKPEEASGHVAVLRFDDAGWCKNVDFALSWDKIQTGRHYPIAPEHESSHAYDLSKRILSIPCHADMTPKDAVCIARKVLAVS